MFKALLILFSICFGVFSGGAYAAGSSDQCRSFYYSRFLRPGPIPEFFPQDTIVLSAFDFNGFIEPLHSRLISKMPKGINTLILVPKFETPDPWFDPVINNYKTKIAAAVPQFDRLQENGRVRFLDVPKSPEVSFDDHGNWTRDFMSQLAIDKDGKLIFLNMKYHRGTADSTDQFVQDLFIKHYAEKFGVHVKRVDVPFFFEWGNYTSDGQGNFFVSEKIFQINKRLGLNLTKTMVKKWITETFGRNAKVHWMKPLKNESTGHVDMVMKFLDFNRVIVSSSVHPDWKDPLDKQAALMTALGYKVTRIEMAIDESEYGQPAAFFRSYTNSLIVGKTAFVPKYDFEGATLRRNDLQAKAIYEELGYTVVTIDASLAICSGGALHCLSSNLPKFFWLPKLR